MKDFRQMKRRGENIDVYAAALKTTFRDDRGRTVQLGNAIAKAVAAHVVQHAGRRLAVLDEHRLDVRVGAQRLRDPHPRRERHVAFGGSPAHEYGDFH